MKKTFISCLGALLIGTGTPGMNIRVASAAESPISLEDAKALGRDGRYEQAITIAQMILLQEPPSENKRTMLFLGLMYYKAGRHTEALAQFKEVATRYQDSTMAYYFMGMIYEAMAVAEQNTVTAKDLKRQALSAWETYIARAEANLSVSAAHTDTGVSREESIKRAQKHISLLQEALQ
jgi:tetratricopeptide (TPR) repeat protein